MKIKKDRISFIVLISLVFLMFLVSGVKIISFIEQLEEGAFLKAELSLVPLTSGEVSGYIYYDKDGDNEMEGDMMVNNAQVELYELVDGQYEIITNTTSNHQGFYEFSSLPEGIYFVKVNPKNLDIEQKPRRSDVNNLLTETPYLPVDGSGSLDIALYSLNVDKQGVFGDNLSVALGDLSKLTDATYWDKLTENINAKYLDLNYDGIVNLKDLAQILDSDYWEFPNKVLNSCTNDIDCEEDEVCENGFCLLKSNQQVPFVQDVFVGGDHNCAILNNGVLKCWGRNSSGQLGNPMFTADYRKLSMEIAYFEGLEIVDMSLGANHTCAVIAGGAVKCWGDNSSGQVGPENFQSEQSVPYRIGVEHTWEKIATGSNHSLAINSDGELFTWGNNDYGQLGHGDKVDRAEPTQVDSTNTWVEVAAGSNHSLAIDVNGYLYSWGFNRHGELGLEDSGWGTERLSPNIVGDANDWVEIYSAGENVFLGASHSIARNLAGDFFSWGNNGYGQLGLADNINRLSPTKINSGNSWVKIAVGSGHTIAIEESGELFSWGFNGSGQLGYLPTISRSSPQSVGTSSNWSMVGAGTRHSLAIDEQGQLFAWGDNSYGQLGNGVSGYSTEIILVDSPNIWTQVAAGSDQGVRRLSYSIAIDSEGRLFSWGANYAGQLGSGKYLDLKYPELIESSAVWQKVSAGSAHILAINENGELFSWGNNSFGQLGRGYMADESYIRTPTTVPGLSNIMKVSVGDRHSCALSQTGQVFCWGLNSSGELGNGTNQQSINSVEVLNISTATDISSGNYHTCILLADKKVSCWGLNSSGQLGDGTFDDRNASVGVNGLSGIKQISAGGNHTCAITDDNEVYCWGDNSSGQLGDGTRESRNLPDKFVYPLDIKKVLTGVMSTCVVTTDNDSYCFGSLGGVLVDTPLLQVEDTKDIKLGSNHICALRNNNVLSCWGNNNVGQLGDNTINSKQKATPGILCHSDVYCQNSFCAINSCNSNNVCVQAEAQNNGEACSSVSTCQDDGTCMFDPVALGLCNEGYTLTDSIAGIIGMKSSYLLNDNQELLAVAGKYIDDGVYKCGGYTSIKLHQNFLFPLFGDEVKVPGKEGFQYAEIINFYIRTNDYICRVNANFTPDSLSNNKWYPLGLSTIDYFKDYSSNSAVIDFQNTENCTYLGPMT
jgi:alpha-tubulin suppressor-like RCC1 family protein